VQKCLTFGRRTGPVQLAAINRLGRSITCTVICSPLKGKPSGDGDGDGDGDGAVLLMEEAYTD